MSKSWQKVDRSSRVVPKIVCRNKTFVIGRISRKMCRNKKKRRRLTGAI